MTSLIQSTRRVDLSKIPDQAHKVFLVSQLIPSPPSTLHQGCLHDNVTWQCWSRGSSSLAVGSSSLIGPHICLAAGDRRQCRHWL